jgi:4,5-DOPA dioxygenase extradiol
MKSQTVSEFRQNADSLPEQEEKLPILFVGHGNPMNSIEDNKFCRTWSEIGKQLPRPKFVLCISAHWETQGTSVTAMERPKTIHDFYGFPRELYEVEYPAPGSRELAEATKGMLHSTEIGLDLQWGLDHGCWSVLSHIFPNADVPVVQLSLDHDKPAQWHYDLARELALLRRKGVLVVGSGNIVHNIRLIDWQNTNGGYDWAIAMNEKLKQLIAHGDHKSLTTYPALGKEASLSIPTPEHYLPLLYVLALKDKDESIAFFNDDVVMGSISMTSVMIGQSHQQ